MLSVALRPLFRRIKIDDAWHGAVRAVAARGPVVYVLRNVSLLDYLALDHLTRRFDLPRIGFVNELPSSIAPKSTLERTIIQGRSAALFLKRPPQRSDLTGRGRSEGAALLESLIALQTAERDIMLMPQTFVWTQRPEKRGFSLTSALFGPADFPGELRQAALAFLNYDNCLLRAGDPLSLRDFLAQQGDDDGVVRRLTYALLAKVERERRTIVGPARKAPDRVREEVLRSPKLQKAIRELAGPDGHGRGVLIKKARQMLREMQTVPDPETQRSLELLAEQILTRVYTGIDVDEPGIERLRELRAGGAVVLLPSHKSHVDYVVLSYVLRKNNIQIPVIAAGDNLAFFPAGPILRRCGAFFIRRKFRGDRLYTAVIDAYIRRLLRDGWMIEFFLEGGRSRTGKVLQPMLGLLNMVVSSALGLDKPVYFVPVSVGYERLMEEGAFARELSGGDKKPEDVGQLLKLGGVLRDRFGRVNVQFGEALELGAMREGLAISDMTPAKRRAIVRRLAYRAMNEINRVTAITPGGLVALVLLSHKKRGMAYGDLLAQTSALRALLLDLGARATPSLTERGVRQALDLYVNSKIVEQHVPGDTLPAGSKRSRLYTGTDVIFTVPDKNRIRLDLAKNQIMHWLVDRALVCVALRSFDAAGEPQHSIELSRRVRSLSRLFKYEFMFRTDAPFETILADTVGDMSARGELELADRVDFYATTMRNFLEAYRIAARGLIALVKGPLERDDVIGRALRLGERMFLQGDIESAEAVSRPMIDNALSSFIDQGYLRRQKDKLALSDTFHSEEGVQAVEGRISAFL